MVERGFRALNGQEVRGGSPQSSREQVRLWLQLWKRSSPGLSWTWPVQFTANPSAVSEDHQQNGNSVINTHIHNHNHNDDDNDNH